MESRYLTDLEWRICHAVNIYVFRNGRDGEQPVLVHIPPAKKKNMKTIMSVIQDRVKYPVGYAKYLFRMDGTRVKDPCELEMYNNYVVASNFEKNFKCATYGRKRSPLIVLNRESKHVRVLRLQNENYYEWLLKKKAVGEERPPYIYPAIFTNENKFAKDLPVGQQGNYNPGETLAPGCCYPPVDAGGKTFRGNQDIVVNTVTIDVPPALLNVPLSKPPKKKPQTLAKGKKSNNNNRKVKLVEPTPSDMLNANFIRNSEMNMSGGSISNSNSESDEKNKSSIKTNGKPIQEKYGSKIPDRKIRKDRDDSSDEFRNRHQLRRLSKKVDSASSSEDLKIKRKQGILKKSFGKQQSGLGDVQQEFGVPPPPTRFRDPLGDTSEKRGDKTILDQNGNVTMSPSGTFYYSPQKIAELNSYGEVQPIELSYANAFPPQSTQQVPPQWGILPQQHLPQNQMVQPMYALKSPDSGNGTHGNMVPNALPLQGVDGTGNAVQFLATNATGPMVQQQVQVASSQGVVGGFTMPQQFPSQQAFLPGPLTPSPRCILIPNGAQGGGPQLYTIPDDIQAQNHLQQVCQLGIIQQPDHQNCMQVDAKTLRQYVDNQKLIEHRFQNRSSRERDSTHPRRRQKPHRGRTDATSTESEVEIPFTPLKTYRLRNSRPENSPYSAQSERIRNPSRYRNERLLPRKKSRNVCIQMGFPASGRENVESALKEYFDNMHAKPSSTRSRTLASDITLADQDNHRGRRRRSTQFFQAPSYSTLINARKEDREKLFLSSNSESVGGVIGGYNPVACSSSVRYLRRAASFHPTSLSDHNVQRNFGSTSIPVERPLLLAESTCNRSSRDQYNQPRPTPNIDELTMIAPPSEFGFPLHDANHGKNHALRDRRLRRSKDEKLSSENNYKTKSSRIDHRMHPPNIIDDTSQPKYMYGLYT